MVSTFYLFFVVASCLIAIQAIPSVFTNNRYSPINALNNNDDEIILAQRAAHFILPPTAFMTPPSQANDYPDGLSTKRQPFGRKHHWDAFFGRRR